MVKIVILGSKEYPFGTNAGDDPNPSGGMETYVDDLVPELSKLCRVAILTRRFRGTKNYERKGNVEVFRVPWLKGKWLRNLSFNFLSFMNSPKFMKDSDIIYSNGVMAGLVAVKLAKLFRKKVVHRPAGIAFSQLRFPFMQMLFALERFVLKNADAVVFHSEGEKRNAQRQFSLPLENGRAILTGFPVRKFAGQKKPRKRPFGLKDEIVITSVCRFVPVKGLEYLLRACASLEGKFKLLLVGSGPEEKKLRSLVSELSIEDKVIFTGFRHDVPDILSMTDIFVISSVSEGLPTSLLEAMAAGNACVVTDIGLPVEHMDTGMVVEPANPFALKNDIQALMSNRKLRKKLGKASKRFVFKNCTQKMAARKHMDLFRNVLSE